MNRSDPFSPEKRRQIMQSVRREDTAPETLLGKALWGAGLRYRKQRRVATAKPDLCFVAAKVALFVDGCFWHGCPRHYKPPINNRAYWEAKVERNQARDRRNDVALEAEGWRVLRFWECEVNKNLPSIVEAVRQVVSALH